MEFKTSVRKRADFSMEMRIPRTPGIPSVPVGGEVVIGSDGVVPEKPLGPVFPGFCGKNPHPELFPGFPAFPRDLQIPGIPLQAGISPWIRRIRGRESPTYGRGIPGNVRAVPGNLPG